RPGRQARRHRRGPTARDKAAFSSFVRLPKGHELSRHPGRLPAGVSYRDGKDPQPFVGWSARILSFLEHEELWRQSLRAYQQTLEFRADPPHPIRTVLPVYTCPADGRTLAIADATGVTVALTEYLGSAGTNLFRQDGVLYLDSRVTLHDVTDGASNTLLVGERPPSADNVLGWWYAGMGQNRDGSADLHLGVRERNVYERTPDCPPGPCA